MNRDPVVERLLALEQFGIKLGLDNIRALVAALGHPQHAFMSIHIAGTNGKGSVSAMIERALRHAGYKTGRYTSPHLARIEERIAVDGEPISERAFHEITGDVLGVVDRLRADNALETTPTFFEATTAIAFEAFRRAAVQVAVIEVGLGGRFDATNVLTPAVCAITSIAFDHERHLGHSLASIAFEKAGILKTGVPAAIGDLPEEARTAIEEVAARVGAELVVADRQLVEKTCLTRGRATISVVTPTARYEDVTLALNGAHQVANAVVAIRVLELLARAGLPVDAASIISGLTDVSWPARLEWLRLPAGGELLIDAAHNVAGAQALANYLRESATAPLPIVLAVMKDKDVRGIVQALSPVAARLVATSVGSSRAVPAGDLADLMRQVASSVPVEAVEDPVAAVAAALPGSARAAAAGSIFLVGPLRARLLAAGAVSFQSS